MKVRNRRLVEMKRRGGRSGRKIRFEGMGYRKRRYEKSKEG